MNLVRGQPCITGKLSFRYCRWLASRTFWQEIWKLHFLYVFWWAEEVVGWKVGALWFVAAFGANEPCKWCMQSVCMCPDCAQWLHDGAFWPWHFPGNWVSRCSTISNCRATLSVPHPFIALTHTVIYTHTHIPYPLTNLTPRSACEPMNAGKYATESLKLSEVHKNHHNRKHNQME